VFRVIVWATDGSPPAEKALPFAVDLAQRNGAKLVVAHVDEVGLGRAAAFAPNLGVEAHLAVFARKVEELKREGIDAEFKSAEVTVGGVADVIVDMARDVGADLIVTGTRGHNPIAELLLGHVTHRLLHIARCPVMVVPSKNS
jgi:nucleotide-binding universal stress UspA family protein